MRTVSGARLVTTLGLLCWAQSANAATIHVGTPSGGIEDGTAEHPFDTRGEGHAAAVSGDTVVVGAISDQHPTPGKEHPMSIGVMILGDCTFLFSDRVFNSAAGFEELPEALRRGVSGDDAPGEPS